VASERGRVGPRKKKRDEILMKDPAKAGRARQKQNWKESAFEMVEMVDGRDGEKCEKSTKKSSKRRRRRKKKNRASSI